jgi:hypothetical protein
VTKAQIKRESIVEYSQNGAGADIRQLWTEVTTLIGQTRSGTIARRVP